MKLEKLLDEIESYKELKDNWDSYGAKPPGMDCCIKAKRILRNLEGKVFDAEVEICPCSEGIGIELTVPREEK